MTRHIEPTAGSWQAVRDHPHRGAVVMLNLLRFRPGGGEERSAEYGAAVLSLLEGCGAEVVYAGAAEATVIGSDS